jgi:Recombination endonuclease VII
MGATDGDAPIPARVGAAVVLTRPLDQYPKGTWATVSEADRSADSYQLRVEATDSAAFIEASRSDFLVVIEKLPRPMGVGDGLGYTSDPLRLEQRYGISMCEYDNRLAAQDGCCAICERHAELVGRPLAVDHDHAIGRVRWLLCDDCNFGLGKFRDRVDLLEAAITYLRDAGAS